MSNEKRLGDAPIELAYRAQMNAIAEVLDETLNGPKGPGRVKKTGFILMLFPFDEVGGEGRANYISNANRTDVVVMLKEQLARFEGQPEMKGRS